jgi:hypothetical protein
MALNSLSLSEPIERSGSSSNYPEPALMPRHSKCGDRRSAYIKPRARIAAGTNVQNTRVQTKLRLAEQCPQSTLAIERAIRTRLTAGPGILKTATGVQRWQSVVRRINATLA